jgi:uncharacterized protein YdiU (UPF0061 family)
MATALGQGPTFDNSYARLPGHFYSRQEPEPVRAPRLIRLNRDLASTLGFDPDGRPADVWAEAFSGNGLLPGAEPLAMAYAGHQFGNFVPQLGDGRALLLGEIIDESGERRDVQLKGAGRTRFSRQGDGRSALGPVLREYVVSEAMRTLGIPTTRALAAVATGEVVARETPLPGAILTRVASSHVRVGTFQYFAARGDHEAVRTLADYVIERHYPDAAQAGNPYVALLRAFADRQADLVARWLGIGFIHGVMNTDNVSIAGETIDFGPCAFLDEYDPLKVFSSIDQMGRYAYARQPQIAQWNLARLAETLLTLLADDQDRAIAVATELVTEFGPRFQDHWLQVFAGKLGIVRPCAADAQLVRTLLEQMQAADADFTLTFRRLSDWLEDPATELGLARGAALDAWLSDWRARFADDADPASTAAAMRRVNPLYIPRNHQLEQMIQAAVSMADLDPFERLLEVLSEPFEERPEHAGYALPPTPGERVTQTFCGT